MSVESRRIFDPHLYILQISLGKIFDKRGTQLLLGAKVQQK